MGRNTTFIEHYELEQLYDLLRMGERLVSNGPTYCSLADLQQIKNLTSIAHALVTVDGEPVRYKHLGRAAESSEKLLEKFGQDSRVEGMYVSSRRSLFRVFYRRTVEYTTVLSHSLFRAIHLVFISMLISSCSNVHELGRDIHNSSPFISHPAWLDLFV
jgi:hypothetical protein